MGVPNNLQIKDEVLVLYDRYGNGLYDLLKFGTVVAITKHYIQVKGLIFKKWYPINKYYIICKIEK